MQSKTDSQDDTSFEKGQQPIIVVNAPDEKEKDVTKIWDDRVSRLDTQRTHTYLRIIWCAILCSAIVVLGNLWKLPQYLIILLTVLNIVFFFLMYVRTGKDFRYIHRDGVISEIEYRKDGVFFLTHPYLVFYKQDNILTCSMMYRVENVPVSVQGNPYALLKTLNDQGITVSYQLMHKPKVGYRSGPITLDKNYIGNFIQRKIQGKNRIPKSKTQYTDATSEQTSQEFDLDAVFTFSAKRRVGLFLNIAIEELTEQMKAYRFLVSTLFAQSYSHHKFSILLEDEIIHMIQGRYYMPVSKVKSNLYELKIKEVVEKTNTAVVPRARLYRAIYYIFVLTIVDLFISWGFASEDWFLIVIISLNVLGCLLIVFSVVFELLQFIQIIKPLDRTFFNPYEHQRLYKHILYPDVLLLFIEELDLMIAMGYKTLGSMTNYFEFNGAKFIRAITGAQHHLPLMYTVSMNPYPEQDFIITHFENLSWNEQLYLCGRNFRFKGALSHKDVIPSRARQWFDWRGGMYEVNHLFETFTFMRATEATISACEILCERILQQTSAIQAYVLSTYRSTQVYEITDTDLSLNCFSVINLKSILPFPFHTRLPLIPTQTKKLADFLKLTSEIKRGITPQLPAEFITPLSVSSDLLFATLFNTETTQSELPVGILEEQLFKGISISGESTPLVNVWAIAMILPGIKKGIPHIIFDRDGSFSSLYGVLSNSSVSQRIHFLKFGKNYHTHWEFSENPSMDHEREYRELLMNAIDVSFNIDHSERLDLKQRLMHVLDTKVSPVLPNTQSQQDSTYTKLLIQRKQIPSITDSSNDPEPGESKRNSSLSGFLQAMTEGLTGKAFLNLAENMVPFADIVSSNNTYIFDLSDLEFEYKLLAEMVMTCKIGHYLNYSPTETQKVLVTYNPLERLHPQKYLRYERFTQFQTLMTIPSQHDWGLVLLNTNVSKIQNYLEKICSTHIGLRTNTVSDKDTLFNLLQLDEFHNHEGNSFKRQSSYQRKFLSKLPLHIAIMKREDHPFPFPIELTMKQLLKLRRPTETEISRHFALQDLDYEKMSKETIERANNCDLRNHFGTLAEGVGKGLREIHELLTIPSVKNPFSLINIYTALLSPYLLPFQKSVNCGKHR